MPDENDELEDFTVDDDSDLDDVGEEEPGFVEAEDVHFEPTEAEQIRYLQNKETNFVFLYGRRQIGKTVITASLLHYLSARCDYGKMYGVHVDGDERSLAGRRLLEIFRQRLTQQRLLDRTAIGGPTEIDVRFEPADKSKDHLWLTFLEMAGESLEEIELRDASPGLLPKNIDVFFKANGLSMVFLLVTSHQKASEDDQLMAQFLTYIVNKDRRFANSRILLLISQWDTFAGEVDLDDFLATRMPLTMALIKDVANAHAHFSIGDVIADVDGQPFLREYHPESAETTFFWLYETLTGQNLRSRWDRFMQWLNLRT